MICPRCRGLLVREPVDGLNIKTDRLFTATRCLNCGCVEDAVMRANRFRPSVKTRENPRKLVRKADAIFNNGLT
jgi:RNase P subunit RPR2